MTASKSFTGTEQLDFRCTTVASSEGVSFTNKPPGEDLGQVGKAPEVPVAAVPFTGGRTMQGRGLGSPSTIIPLFLRRVDLEDEALYRGANHTNRPRAFIGGLIQKACHREGQKISISKAYNFWKRLRKGETPAT